VADVELLDRTLDLNGLLYRLFHEEQVRVFQPSAIQARLPLLGRAGGTNASIDPREELEDLKVDGEIVVTCEFCSTNYRSPMGLRFVVK